MQVIGHRGAAALAPENTWESFDVALQIGVDAIETDIRATRDGELVLIHDASLERTTGAQGLVHTTPWSTLRILDAGSWFAGRFATARIPRLEDTLIHYGPLTHLVLEIKQAGIEEQVLEMVRDLDLLERVTFTSFESAPMRNIKAKAASAKVGFLTPDITRRNVMRVVDAGWEQFCPPASLVTRQAVVCWKALGLEVRAWGVKDAVLMIKAIDAGVDGMTVDFPHLLLRALGRGHG
jgi:glycerophosphoryl diester phosphodiesterase